VLSQVEADRRVHAIAPRSVERLARHIGPERVQRTHASLAALAQTLGGRRIVNVTGDDRSKGGVFEILRTTLPYLSGAGIGVEWIDLRTDAATRPTLEYFHVLGHGTPPTRAWREELPAHERRLRDFGRAAARDISSWLRPSDIVVLHDTQAAPAAEHLDAWHTSLVWRSHIGTTARTACVMEYWRVLNRALSHVRAAVFYRPEYAPPDLKDTSVILVPSIDPSSPKNAVLGRSDARLALAETPASPIVLVLTGDIRTLEDRSLLVVQVARWDPLKGMDQALAACARRALVDPRGPFCERAERSRRLPAAACQAASSGRPADACLECRGQWQPPP
jgi:hypothetical protein